MQTDEDLYAKQVYCLGMYYKWAVIGLETNFSTFPQKELERLGYPNFYVREVFDNFSKTTTKQFGFLTTKKTKPVILSNLVQIVRESVEVINHKKTLEEMLTMVKKENGKQEAEDGYHDDKVMSIAIAYHVVDQIAFDEEEIRVNPQYHFNIEKAYEPNDDLGDIVII
jgi:phage terminase large subunit